MTKAIILLILNLFITQVSASEIMIEHQIRVCDSDETILKALKINPKDLKPRKIYYLETTDRKLKENKYTFRIKVKNSKVEIDLKKRIDTKSNDPIYENGNCEIDKHAYILEKTCKSTNESTDLILREILLGNKSWHDLLSKEQISWLKNDQLLDIRPHFYGVLDAKRGEVSIKELGVLTLDLVHVENQENVTYHELSIRYSISELNKNAQIFEEMVKASGIEFCNDQINWAIDKFDVLTIKN